MPIPPRRSDRRSWRSNDNEMGSEGGVSTSPYLTPTRGLFADTPPYKPSASDRTSLSMKKRHHPERSRGNTAQGGSRQYSTVIARSKSLPFLRKRGPSIREGGIFSPTRVVGKSSSTSTYTYRRRWTLPSKAASTRGLSTLSPLSKHNNKSRREKSRPSPAVITLRRATNNLSCDTDLTFFPPPRFNRTRTTLMDYFLSSISQDNQQQGGWEWPNDSKARRYDVLSHQPARNNVKKVATGETASPTITEVALNPSVSTPYAEFEPSRLRRCSTRYVTRNSVYEIVWDENDTPTGTSKSSSPPGIGTSMSTRRASIAATKLEGQLRRDERCSVRMSSDSSSEQCSNADIQSRRKISFQSMLNASFSRLANEAALQHLPRSRGTGNYNRSAAQSSADEPIQEKSSSSICQPSRADEEEIYPLFQTSDIVRTPRIGLKATLEPATKSRPPMIHGGGSKHGDGDFNGTIRGGSGRNRNKSAMGVIRRRMDRQRSHATPKRRRQGSDTVPLLNESIWEGHAE